MHVNELCRARRIATIKWSTPLLVPSFSSRGFADLPEMHRQLGEHTTDSSLVSAYDIYLGHLNSDSIYCSDVLFIDSGGFETGSNSDLSDLYGQSGRASSGWSEELHAKVIRSLDPLCPLVVVNYDACGLVSEQVLRAMRFFESMPQTYASDFLVKPPSTEADYIDLKDIINHAEELSNFDVIGVTEKELGSSFLQRCKNLVSLRRAFQDRDIHMPIHVFGGLDPLSVLAYFLCGADVFDGLSWLRLAYHNGAALYLNSYALIQGQWARSNHSVFVRASLENLEHLSRTQAVMARFARTHDWTVLELEDGHLRQLQALVGAAGVDL